MKVGDLVLPSLGQPHLSPSLYGIGVILDTMEMDDGRMYFEVQFNHERGWWAQEELKMFHES